MFGRVSKVGWEEGKLYSGEKGRLQACPGWSLLAWGSWDQASKKPGILGDWSGEHIWLSLAGPQLE